MSKQELAKILGYSRTTIHSDLSKLQELTVIKRVGGTRGYWQVNN